MKFDCTSLNTKANTISINIVDEQNHIGDTVYADTITKMVKDFKLIRSLEYHIIGEITGVLHTRMQHYALIAYFLSGKYISLFFSLSVFKDTYKKQ